MGACAEEVEGELKMEVEGARIYPSLHQLWGGRVQLWCCGSGGLGAEELGHTGGGSDDIGDSFGVEGQR